MMINDKLTGWWFGTMEFLCSPIVGMMIQSDFYIFQGVGIPPISDSMGFDTLR